MPPDAILVARRSPEHVLKFAINRLDMSGIDAFARSAARAEALGWDYGLIPCSPLLVRDPYVLLVVRRTRNQSHRAWHVARYTRHPTSRRTRIVHCNGRRTRAGAYLARPRRWRYRGALNGLSPARVATLERAVVQTRALLAGESVDVGTARPARLRHAQPVPVWVAAQGPRALRWPELDADGVFIRVGTIRTTSNCAYHQIVEGAKAAGREPSDLDIGAIFHTAVDDDAARALTLAKSIAAGYFEYSPFLFHNLALPWAGPDVALLKQVVDPDFHHARNLLAAGQVVDFLPRAAADAFALYGDFDNNPPATRASARCGRSDQNRIAASDARDQTTRSTISKHSHAA